MHVGPPRQRNRVLGWLLASVLLAITMSVAATAAAAPKLRFQTDVKGDIVTIGNALGQECRTVDTKGMSVPMPVVGTIGNCGDPITLGDSAPDVLWRSEDGSARADAAVTIDQARSTAFLSIPPGSQVLYARVYWGGNLGEDIALAASAVTLERLGSGGGSATLVPNANTDVATTVGGGGGLVYQSTYDVTSIVQRYGTGAYRLSNTVRRNLINRDEDVQFNAWSMVVVYRNDKEPVRNIVIYDGLDAVDFGRSVSLGVIGFRVPEGGVPQGRLGVIAYEGDTDKKDSLQFNNSPVTDAHNPADNIFNSSRTLSGMPVSVAGDLPQLTGTPGSMSGLDLDQIDVSSLLKANDTQATIQANSVDDVYFVGALFTAIRSRKPVIDTTLIADPSAVRPGDTVTFTSTTKNIGDDEGTGIVIRHPLPDGMTYVPGSIVFVSGPEASQNGPKSDKPSDDQAEVVTDPMTGKPVLVIRVGKGASGNQGGSLSPTDAPVVVQYKLKTEPNAMMRIPTQSTTTVGTAGNPGLPPATFPSGNGEQPGAPTIVNVPSTSADLRVTVTKTPSQPQPGDPVRYGVDVSNVGTATDPGPIHVTFKVPPSGVIDSVTPGPGWTCTQQERVVRCTRQEPLQPGESSHAVDISVRNPNPPSTDNEVVAQVGSDGAVDPNPADNIWNELTANRRIAGGGIGCSVGASGSASSGFALAALALLLAVALRRKLLGHSK